MTDSGTRPTELPPYFSPTSLKSFLTCPKQFEFGYILREKVDEEPQPNLILANTVHAALAHLYREAFSARSEARAHQLLRHAWARIPDRHRAFISDEEQTAWGRRALEALSWYSSRYPLMIRPLGVESWVEAELPNGRVVAGRVDRIDRAVSGTPGVEIIDYKTGRCWFEDDELKEDLAARLYALAAARTYKQPCVKVSHVYLVDKTERYWLPEQEDLELVEEELVELTDRIAGFDAFVPDPAPRGHCRWCKFRDLCPVMDTEAAQSADLIVDVGF